MTTSSRLNVTELATSIVRCFPSLNVVEQRLSLELYRLLAEGQPVPRAALAERAEVTIETLNRILQSWPGVFSDKQHRVVGYWGLSLLAAYSSPHTLRMSGQRLSAWCAWDTLFLPELAGHTAEVESASPGDAGIVRLTITPQQLERVEPVASQMSVLVPNAQEMQKNVITSFCHFVHFFPSQETGETWAGKHPETFLVSMQEAHTLARLKNEMQYRDVFQSKRT